MYLNKLLCFFSLGKNTIETRCCKHTNIFPFFKIKCNYIFGFLSSFGLIIYESGFYGLRFFVCFFEKDKASKRFKKCRQESGRVCDNCKTNVSSCVSVVWQSVITREKNFFFFLCFEKMNLDFIFVKLDSIKIESRKSFNETPFHISYPA